MRVCILYRGVSVAALVGLGACASAPRPSPVTASAPPNVTWERWAATNTDDAFERVAVGSDGAVYATGRDRHGAFVARFAPDGARSWRHTLHGVTAGAPPSVAVSPAGEVYVGGGFEGRFRVEATAFTARGRKDIFLARFDATGALAWARQYGGPHFETAHAVATDARGDVYLAGTYQDECELGGVTLRNGADMDAFVAKLDARGAHVWSARFQDRGNLDSRVAALAVGIDGDVYVTGSLQRDVLPVAAAPGEDVPDHAFVARVAPGGGFRWLRTVEASERATGTGIALGADGRVVVTGLFEGALTVPGSPALQARGTDVFVTAFSGRGTHRWTRAFGSEGIDTPSAVAVTDGGEVFVGGRVAGEVRFGDAVWPAENVEGFVARFDREGASRDRRMFASPSADEVRDLRVERGALVVVGVGGALRLATERTRRDDTLDGFVYRASVAAFGAAPGPSLARVTADEPGGDLPARPLPARPDEAGSRIRIALTSEDESYANAPFHVEAEGWSFEGTISAQGVVEFRVPSAYRRVTLRIPRASAEYPVTIGDLDPIDERTGVIERLTHLGYYGSYGGEDDSRAPPDDAAVLLAVRSFQRAQSLPPTGGLDAETLAALRRAHGS